MTGPEQLVECGSCDSCHGFTQFERNRERHHDCQTRKVLDWQRALRLFAETMREIGILIVVFVPLDYVLADRPIGPGLAIVTMRSSIGIACATLIESIKFKS